MTRDVDRCRRSIARHDEDVLIEIHVSLIEDDPLRVEAPLEFDATIPSRSKKRLFAGGQVEHHQIAQTTEKSERHAVGRRRRATVVRPGLDQWTDHETHGICPTSGVEQWIRLIFGICVVLHIFFFSRLRGRVFPVLRLLHVLDFAGILVGGGIIRIQALRIAGRFVTVITFIAFITFILFVFAGARPIRVVLLDLLPSPRDCGRHDRGVSSTHGRKIERGSVRTPRQITFSTMRLGHSARWRIILRASNHDLAVRDHRDRFPIRVECRLGDPQGDVEILFGIERVFRRCDHQRTRDRIRIVEIHREERIPSVQNNLAPVGGCVESRDIDLFEVGDRLGFATSEGLTMNVLGRVETVGKKEHRVITRPSRLPVISLPVGQRREGAGHPIVNPDVSTIVTSIVPPLPLRIATFECGPSAIGASNVETAEGVVQSTRLAAFNGNLIGPWRTIEITFEIPRESHDHLAIRIETDPPQGHGGIEIGDSPQPSAIRGHCPEIGGPISITFEHDGGTIRRPSRIMITAWMAGESRGGAPSEWDLPEIPPPTEDNGLSIRADARESRKVDVPFRPKHAGTPGICCSSSHLGKPENQKADRPHQ